ncbi:uncharacterized protein LOC134830900 isoform X2 [Culicoides brevitarsis]|uniref:uncharacterized protein LOC134830900 isoform X2 n=1 Tax=Culicoides brevitarsis TaxID=469753 RepID=UPI00307B15A3
MKLWIQILVATIAIISCCVVLAARVDSKLDFGEVAARVEEQKESRESVPTPNVRNVRVTVETKNEKGSPESKSSESSESSSSGDRTSSGSIGVRTDVTFEISNETNETRSQEDNNNKKKTKKKKNGEDDDDDDIPVIKGRTTPPKKKVDVTTWRPKVRPVFPKSESDETIRSRAGPPNVPWTKNFPGNAVWTTERNYFGLFDNYDNFHPSQPVGKHAFVTIFAPSSPTTSSISSVSYLAKL